MPYVEGETLRTKIDREKQLGVDDAIALARAVASALEHAHKQGVVHRDIKPENILLRDSDPVVADFGIALAVSHAGGNRLTETGLSVGTPHYMSPEQAMGDRELDARSDVYSLGAVMYEMLTGEPPYTGSTAQAIVARVITEDPRPITLQRRTVPPHVADAVHKALNKLPADRFSSAASFAEALITPGYVTPSKTRAGAAVPPPRDRNRTTLLLSGALAVAVVAAAVGWMRSAAEPAPTQLRIAFMNHPIPPGLVARDLALAPDGGTIVFSDTAGGQRQLWIKGPDRADPSPLPGTAEGIAPAFSPDGSWIAFLAEGRLKKVPRQGGSPVTLADSAAVTTGVHSVAWMPNGTIAFTTENLGVALVHQDGGTVRRRTWIDTLAMAVVSVSGLAEGDAWLLSFCTFGCPESQLYLWEPRTASLRTVVGEALRAWQVSDDRVVFVRRDGGVFIGAFDVRQAAFRTPPVPVLDGVRTLVTDADMALAANGTLLYVPGGSQEGGAPLEVVWVARDGRATLVDSGWAFAPANNGGIALSPDGRRLALGVRASGADDIWIKELDRGPFTRLTFEGTNARPIWSRDGRHVLYITAVGNHGDVLRRRADGTAAAEALVDATRSVWEIALPPDTTRMILRLGVPPSRDIVLFDRATGAPVDSSLTPLMASDGFEETVPALSPDGRWLAYTTNESGRYEVYVRPWPDVSAGRWQVSRDGGSEPQWAHSGRELFYRNGRGEFVAAAVVAGSGFATGEHRVLFSASGFIGSSAQVNYAVAPGDQRFLFQRIIRTGTGDEEAYTAVLIQHWLNDPQGAGARGR
jgi:serine/threonine-protein kinase